jgi:hypothetical protein
MRDNSNKHKEGFMLEDAVFEDSFFGYNNEEDPDGGIGIELLERARIRAQIDGLSLPQWVTVHKVYYQIRNDKEPERYPPFS